MAIPGNHHQTLIVPNRHAMRYERRQAAFGGFSGLRILTLQSMAERLAGGLWQVANQTDIKESFRQVSDTPLGDLDNIKELPGFPAALCASLTKCWRANLSLEELAQASREKSEFPRLDQLRNLEQGIRDNLMPGRMLLPDLVSLAHSRLPYANRLFGTITFKGFLSLEPVWQNLVAKLSQHASIFWDSGVLEAETWLSRLPLKINSGDPVSPKQRFWYECETFPTELTAAMRWARELITTKTIPPSKISIVHHASTLGNTNLLALARSSTLPLHFAQGIPAMETPEGQLAAALAKLHIKGLSREGVLRLVSLLIAQHPDYANLRTDWWHDLPYLPIKETDHWHYHLDRLKEKAPADQAECLESIHRLIRTLARPELGSDSLGEEILPEKALGVWTQALASGPDKALELLIKDLSLPDPSDPGTRILVGPASLISCTPRPFTWIAGMNHGAWPSLTQEDSLLPSHIVSQDLLAPIRAENLAGRHFRTVEKTTSEELVCSYSKQNLSGSESRASTFFRPGDSQIIILRRNMVARHAVSESDRMMARPESYAETNLGKLTRQTWSDWQRSDCLLPHDGGISASHPLITECLNRSHSATSLKRLLRDPLGYLWSYGFGWNHRDLLTETLALNPKQYGSLLHAFLEETLLLLNKDNNNGLASASESDLRSAISQVRCPIVAHWGLTEALPPKAIWLATLKEVQEMTIEALLACQPEAGCQSWAEVPFGGERVKHQEGPNSAVRRPWDAQKAVQLPRTNILIKGYIDRLDFDKENHRAWVVDFKSAKNDSVKDNLDGGKEIQRCLYAAAVKTLLGDHIEITPSLLFPRQACKQSPLSDPDEALRVLAEALNLAFSAFEEGKIFSGPGALESYYDFKFALPAQATTQYLKRKQPLFEELHPLGETFWKGT